jgi:hypothetical protein
MRHHEGGVWWRIGPYLLGGGRRHPRAASVARGPGAPADPTELVNAPTPASFRRPPPWRSTRHG